MSISRPNNTRRTTVTAYALAIGVAFITLLSLLPLSELFAKLLDKGRGSIFLYPFTIQNLMWCIFFAGLGELYYRHLQAKRYWQSLKSGYLPEQPDVVLTQHDMGAIYRAVKNHKDELSALIGNLVLRFQAGQSVEQTHEMLNSQLDQESEGALGLRESTHRTAGDHRPAQQSGGAFCFL